MRLALWTHSERAIRCSLLPGMERDRQPVCFGSLFHQSASAYSVVIQPRGMRSRRCLVWRGTAAVESVATVLDSSCVAVHRASGRRQRSWLLEPSWLSPCGPAVGGSELVPASSVASPAGDASAAAQRGGGTRKLCLECAAFKAVKASGAARLGGWRTSGSPTGLPVVRFSRVRPHPAPAGPLAAEMRSWVLTRRETREQSHPFRGACTNISQ